MRNRVCAVRKNFFITKNFSRFFFTFYLQGKIKITLQGKMNVNSMIGLKGIFRGSLKTTSRNKKKLQGLKNPNFWVRISSAGVGVFHVKGGWGPKNSVCPSKPGKPNFFGGISRDFAGVSRRCPKSQRKKISVQFSFPIQLRPSKICDCLLARLVRSRGQIPGTHLTGEIQKL